jgi:C4-dicarboxylate transporter/malic acid transport protein
MSTGGLALLLANQPYTFPGLQYIGEAVYFINVVFFILVCSLMVTRFILHRCLLDSLRHDREGLFFPTFWLSIATIICGLHKYFGGPGAGDSFRTAERALFWGYCACTLIVVVVQYSFVFSEHTYHLQTMMPSWILPAFPIMLSGTIASVIAAGQPTTHSLSIVTAGTTFQGLGLSISVLMYAHCIGRLMQSGLPGREHRPGLFICVGPPAFTALALIGMADALPDDFRILVNGDLDSQVMQILAIASGAFLWALSLWFFCIAVIAVVRSPPTSFHLNWWAMVFPNTGFTIATITLGKAFHSPGIMGVGSAMSVGIVLMWIFVFVSNVRAVMTRSIVYPGRDEDISE